jgi:hypothetical protein
METDDAQVNYIKHLTGFFDKVIHDDRLNPTHISLYVSLFQFWNMQRFQNPISISRDEVMRVSKICSKATYHKCMKDLHTYNYLFYDPSYNPFRGSLITFFNLELKEEQQQKKQTNNMTKNQTSSELVVNKQRTSVEQALVPYINNINYLNNINNSSTQKKNKKEKTSFVIPFYQEIADYFKAKNHNELEAQKFFNHYESNGWKVGGRTPMKNWQAAANNWMINAQKFNPTPTPPQNNLHVNQNKDYDIPL